MLRYKLNLKPKNESKVLALVVIKREYFFLVRYIMVLSIVKCYEILMKFIVS